MLSVVTLTRGNSTTLDRCRASVDAALFEGAQHDIVLCPDAAKFNTIRFETSSTLNEFTAIVDDDDIITPDALRLCQAAIETYDADIVFTDEIHQMTNVSHSYKGWDGQRSYRDVTNSPLAIHHLVVMRSSLLDKRCLEFTESRYEGIGIEWMMHSCLALQHKVVHVPKSCYTWHRHNAQHSVYMMDVFNRHFPTMRKDIVDNWGMPKGLIQMADLSLLEDHRLLKGLRNDRS